MLIVAIITGEYGQRHVDNIRARGPAEWQIEVWQAPSILPPIKSRSRTDSACLRAS